MLSKFTAKMLINKNNIVITKIVKEMRVSISEDNDV